MNKLIILGLYFAISTYALSSEKGGVIFKVFNTDILLPESCLPKTGREFICTEDESLEFMTLKVIDYDYSVLSNVFAELAIDLPDALISQSQTSNFEIFEVKSSTGSNISIYICDAYSCLRISGDFNMLLDKVKAQLLGNV